MSGSAAQSAGAGSSFVPEAETLFAAMSVQPDTTRKTLIDSTIAALIAAGAWTKYEEFFMFAAHDVQAALLNWVNPAESAIRVGSATFTTDRGFTGDQSGGTGTMQIQSARNVNTGQFTSGSAHWSTYVNAGFGGDSNNIELGTSSFNLLHVLAANGNYGWGIQNTSEGVVSPGASGSWIGSTSSPTATLYRNGASIRTRGHGGTTSEAAKMTWLGRPSAWSNRRLAYGTYGSFLSSGEASAMHSILLTYLTAIGAP